MCRALGARRGDGPRSVAPVSCVASDAVNKKTIRPVTIDIDSVRHRTPPDALSDLETGTAGVLIASQPGENCATVTTCTHCDRLRPFLTGAAPRGKRQRLQPLPRYFLAAGIADPVLGGGEPLKGCTDLVYRLCLYLHQREVDVFVLRVVGSIGHRSSRATPSHLA